MDDASKEARRGIEEARTSGATELDLSGLGLTDLPSEIGRLQALESLDLKDNQLTDLPSEIGQLYRLRLNDSAEPDSRWNRKGLGSVAMIRGGA